VEVMSVCELVSAPKPFDSYGRAGVWAGAHGLRVRLAVPAVRLVRDAQVRCLGPEPELSRRAISDGSVCPRHLRPVPQHLCVPGTFGCTPRVQRP
jgi:hypothetical protein